MVTLALFKKFLTDKFFGSLKQDLRLFTHCVEHDAAWACAKMERNGYPMNSEIVEGLYREPSIKRAELLDKLRSTFGSWYSPKGGKEFFKHPRTGRLAEVPASHIPEGWSNLQEAEEQSSALRPGALRTRLPRYDGRRTVHTDYLR
ncbi:DNA polymerase [Enterobacter phage 01_vB_Eclo_IJM]|nr:DNA polymerase [Enterobacter phage 01_vB_Eclo_IJM]